MVVKNQEYHNTLGVILQVRAMETWTPEGGSWGEPYLRLPHLAGGSCSHNGVLLCPLALLSCCHHFVPTSLSPPEDCCDLVTSPYWWVL